MPKSGPATRTVAPCALGAVEDELRVLAPGLEQPVLEAVAGDLLEPVGRDDLVGVDVAAAQRDGPAGVRGECFHGCSDSRGRRVGSDRSAGEARWPSTAVAAATCGETRWVRPPLPCRPSKLRLEVDAERSPGASWSGFMPRHIEQPACRHSAPASVKTLSRPSSTACSATRTEPGTTSIRTPSATLRPSRMRGGGAQVLDPAVGAGADEDGVDLDVAQRLAGAQPHVLQGLFGGVALRSVLVRSRVGDATPTAARPGRGWCPR